MCEGFNLAHRGGGTMGEWKGPSDIIEEHLMDNKLYLKTLTPHEVGPENTSKCETSASTLSTKKTAQLTIV